MAPARMISFMENHARNCAVCQDDPDIFEEIDKIREIILPESKIPKAVRMQNDLDEEKSDDEELEDNEEELEDNDDEEDVDDEYHTDDDFVEEPDLLDDDK